MFLLWRAAPCGLNRPYAKNAHTVKRKKCVDTKKSCAHIRRMENFSTPRQIIAHIGAEQAAHALGVPLKTVRRKLYEDRLPAAWYFALSESAGEPLPRGLFTFKGAA